jgi:hypothetical protein
VKAAIAVFDAKGKLALAKRMEGIGETPPRWSCTDGRPGS